MMRIDEFKDIVWLEPWESADIRFELELAKEAGFGHPLYGRKAVTVGRRVDRDDVLFFLPGNDCPLAVVHLTWAGQRESSPNWPHITFYSSLEDWIENCMKPDHLEYAGDERTV